ncbi:MAG: choice-of-anchor W domain-containing protein [Pseudomonadota bacterium]
MRLRVLVACFAAVVVAPAGAVATYALDTFSSLPGDFGFSEVCARGSAAGTGNQACELAVGELRGGNNALGGDWEIGVQDPPGTARDVQGFVWSNASGRSPEPVLPFILSFDRSEDANGGDDILRLTVGTTTSATRPFADGLAGMETMFIRARSEGPDDRIELLNMAFNGLPVGDLLYQGPGSSGAAYIILGGVDFSSDWTLTGAERTVWQGASIPSASRLDVNFKLTDAPVAMPVPGTGWLLLSALGLGYTLKRRRAR